MPGEKDLERLIGTGKNAHRTLEIVAPGGGKGGSGGPRAAGERFALDAALIGSDAQAAGGIKRGEVHIGAGGAKGGMGANGGSESHPLIQLEIVHKENGVGNAGVEALQRPGVELHLPVNIAWLGHFDLDALALDFRLQESMHGFDAVVLAHASQIADKLGQTADAVAAHFRFAAIGVKNAHAVVCFLRRFQQNQAIRADAALPLAKAGNQSAILRKVA